MAGGLFPDLKPHHVGISVRDMDEAIDFWSEVFGFELDFKAELKGDYANWANEPDFLAALAGEEQP